MIQFEDVSVQFGANPILHNIHLTLHAHHRTALVGRSGSGKSTLLRLINRLIEPSSGRILHSQRSIGFVSQHLGLFPHWTARHQIARFHKHPENTETLAASFGLSPEHLDRYPHQLSGGQQQRVALARALASNPPLLLLDEPFSALDPLLRRELQDLILTLDKTIVFVTHDLREALRLGERIVFLSAGHVIFDGTPQELYASGHPEVEAYLRTLES